MSIRTLIIAAALAVGGLSLAACQPAAETKEAATAEGAMASDGAMAADKMAPAAGDSMAPAADKMAPAH